MTQTLLTIFIPTFMVLVGILLNRNDTARLDGRISQMETRLVQMETRLDNRLNSLEVRLSGLEGRFHSDMILVIGKLNELDVRIARLEVERQGK